MKKRKAGGKKPAAATAPALESREPTAAALADPTAGALLQSLAVTDLVPWPGLNPRQHFDPAALQELTDSIAAVGVKEPLGVRLNPTAPHYVFKGERRLRAALAAGLTHVPAVVREINEGEAFQLALLENAQRSELTAVEEARAIKRYQELYPEAQQDEIGAIFGYGAAWVSNRLRLLELPAAAMALIEDGLIQPSSARDHMVPLVRIPDAYAAVRDKIFAAIDKGVRAAVKREGKTPLEDPETLDVVNNAIDEYSYPLAKDGHGTYYTGAGNVNSRAYVTEKAYKAAGLPTLEIKREWGAKSTVALDGAWWKDANKEAGAAATAREKKAQKAQKAKKRTQAQKNPAELVAKQEAGKPIDLTAYTEKAQAIRKGTHRLCKVGGGRTERENLVIADPRALPRERLHLVKEYSGQHYIAFIGELEEIQDAELKAERAIAQSIRNKRLARGKADAHEVDGRAGVAAVPDLVALLSGLGRWTGKNGLTDPTVIIATLNDLGVDTSQYAAEDADQALEGDELVQAVLMGIPPAKVEQLARVLALRLTRGDFETWRRTPYGGIEDPLEVDARKRWLQTQDRMTRELITFELPEKLKATATIVEDEEEAEPTCRVCGCTEDEPCDEGCSWVPEKEDERGPICSACDEKGLDTPAPAVGQGGLELDPAPASEAEDEQAHGPDLGGSSSAEKPWRPRMPQPEAAAT